MSPADSIINKLGGAAAVANALGVHRTRPYDWMKSRAEGGTDGQIPQRHIPALMDYAKLIDVPLVLDEFYPAQSVEPAGVQS